MELTATKDDLRFALTRHGAQCVMMPGTTLMPTLHVDSWDTHDSVSCLCYHETLKPYQLYSIDAVAYSEANFGQGTGSIFIDNTDCVGDELRLTSCRYDNHTADCTHAEDAGLRCSGRRKPSRLINMDYKLRFI